MAGIIADPECDGFYGVYAGGSETILPPPQYDMTKMVQYMKQKGKLYFELTEKEKEQFMI